MDISQTFTEAIRAEKNAGIAFVFLGIAYLALCLCLFVYGRPLLLIGAKWPALLAGLFIVIGGIFFVRSIDKRYRDQFSQSIKGESEFVQSETARATKLVQGYKQYTPIWIVMLIGSLVLVSIFSQSIYGGIGYVVLIYSVFTIFNEMYGSIQTAKYLTALKLASEKSA